MARWLVLAVLLASSLLAGCASTRFAVLDTSVTEPGTLRAASRVAPSALVWDFQPDPNWEGLSNWDHHVSQSTRVYQQSLSAAFSQQIRGRALADSGDETPDERDVIMSVRIYDIVRDWNPFTGCCDYVVAEVRLKDASGVALAEARLRANTRRAGVQPWTFGARMQTLTQNLAEAIVIWLRDVLGG